MLIQTENQNKRKQKKTTPKHKKIPDKEDQNIEKFKT